MNCHRDGAARLAVLPRAGAVELPPAAPPQLGCGTQKLDAVESRASIYHCFVNMVT